jgi:hypothetical protein
MSEDVALTDVLDADPRYLSAANRRWSAVSHSLDQRPPVIRVLIGISTDGRIPLLKSIPFRPSPGRAQ